MIIGLALSVASMSPSMAVVSLASASTTAKAGSANTAIKTTTTRMTDLVNKADQEINRRTGILNAVNTRIQSMQKVSSAEKQSLDATIKNQITVLTALKLKIDADTDLKTLQADVASITKSYRIYALIVPQADIMAAADRALTITGNMTTLSGKLQTRIANAQASGKNVTSLQTALTDYNAKIKDAESQAQAAETEITGLVPDQGDKAKMQSNLSALKDAKSKIRAAQQDFVAARQDAQIIANALKEFGSSSANTSVQSNSSPSVKGSSSTDTRPNNYQSRRVRTK